MTNVLVVASANACLQEMGPFLTDPMRDGNMTQNAASLTRTSIRWFPATARRSSTPNAIRGSRKSIRYGPTAAPKLYGG